MIAAGMMLIVSVIAYLLGSIPFGFLLVLIFRREDIRTKGSGNIGATNVVRSGAKVLGAFTFLLDAAKGYVAVFATGWLLGDWFSGTNLYAVAAIAAVLGHMYPVWLGFKGGKGVATAFGAFLALSLWAALIGLAIFAVVMMIWRYVSLASIVSAIAFPVLALLLRRGQPSSFLFMVAVIFIPVMVILKHDKNIQRLLNGTEYRFGKAKPAV